VVLAIGVAILVAASDLWNFVPQLRQTIMLPGCGYWTQQERAGEVNAAMTDFLRDLPSESAA
jgi:pimeloyl-ACP methyl ester carboxylesterase